MVRRISSTTLAVVLWTLWAPQLFAQDHAPPKVRVTPDYLSGPEAEAAALFANVLPTVVTIFTASRAVTPDGGQDERGIGSGVLISPECHVLTAAHVIEGADAILVKTHDGNLHAAELLYSESGADIASL